MKTVFEEFGPLWKEQAEQLKPLLATVEFLYYPDETKQIHKLDPEVRQKTIIVMKSGELVDNIKLIGLGYEHCVQRARPDFMNQMIASCLMTLRPAAFSKDPIPFFLTGFVDAKATLEKADRNLVMEFQRSSEKGGILDKLRVFLEQNPRLSGIADIAIQVADELITNAFFNAPAKKSGERPFQALKRSTDVGLPDSKKPKFFSCYSDTLLVVGCEDLYGSIEREKVVAHIEKITSTEKASHRTESAGAGVGFKFIIENSANFYLYCEPSVKTVVAATFLLKGVRANAMSDKHIHLSVR